MMNREIIPGRKKEGSTVSSINCDHCRHLDLAASMLSAVKFHPLKTKAAFLSQSSNTEAGR